MHERFDSLREDLWVLLEKSGLVSGADGCHRSDSVSCEMLAGDASPRIFVRIRNNGEPVCVAVLPSWTGKREMAEFRSSFQIAGHLGKAGVPVPAVLGVDEEKGVILYEDLGDVRLHDLVVKERGNCFSLYRDTVKALVKMQVAGGRGFKTDFCYDTPTYDRKTMLERESGYFLESFWGQTLFAEDVVGLQEEFEQLADTVMEYSEPLFLHRDFQSRNIMVSNGEVRIIDFQGGRLGPPGYDLASLLIDPYAALSDSLQADLFSLYVDEMSGYRGVDVEKIRLSYPYLAVQRNLQIIGAFSYLSGRMGKSFFKPYILPSLIMLQNRLEDREFIQFQVLKSVISTAIQKYRRFARG